MAEKILIVEDEEKLNRMLQLELRHEGYEVGSATDGTAGLEMALSGNYDLVLLDIMLPGLNGMEVLRRIRRVDPALSVIMVTARDTAMDQVAGLDAGADDYITKPFSNDILLAHIRAALRKKGTVYTAPTSYTVQGVTVEPESRRCIVNGEEIALTRKEFDLLSFLMENRGRVLSNEDILERVWDFNYVGETNTVAVYIRFLRRDLEEACGVKLIETVRGVGYVIR